MAHDLNAVDKAPHIPNDDLVTKLGRYSRAWMFAFFITLFILLAQNLIYMLLPKDILAAENGLVIGQVQFDESSNRDADIITADLKTWVSRCTSVNKLTIYEDLSVCLRHMNEELAEAKLAAYREMNNAPYVENYGCERTETQFFDDQTQFDRDLETGLVDASLSGQVLCVVPGEKPKEQQFSVRTIAMLVDKTSNNPLGFTVQTFEDIE